MRQAPWFVLGVVALLWPGRVVGPLDGLPLDGALEATLLGVVVPALWWLNRGQSAGAWTRGLVVLVLAWKLAGTLTLTQQGLCVSIANREPIQGINQGIPVIEPHGVLRSWDVRADLRAERPACTAIFAGAWPTFADVPAWFVNVTDPILRDRDFTMTVRGAVTLAVPRSLTLGIGQDMTVTGTVGSHPVGESPMTLAAGTHQLDLAMTLRGDRWRFDPRIDGAPLASGALLTTSPPTALDRFAGRWAGWVTALLAVALLAAWLWSAVRHDLDDRRVVGAAAALATVAVLLAAAPDPWPRAAGLLGFAAVLMPVTPRLRNVRGAFLLIGVPWLAFIAARAWPDVGRFSVYSVDDWLAYQVAGYRIFMHGYWLEGGNAVFDFQPLYRWVTGALHLIFGDSSVGELYWDGLCLLIGALLAFQLIKPTSGFRWSLAASAATLATWVLGTPWYFIGRGLSEITAAGFAFIAVAWLLRGRRGSLAWILGSGVAAVLMFYTRLNHLLLAAFLPVFLLSRRVPSATAELVAAFRRWPVRRATVFAAVFVGGVLAFMARTWYYTGAFSLFRGTSLPHNDTGLRPWTLFDLEAWSKVGHSLAATLWMNEPPHPDPRALFMVLGALAAVGALLQFGRLRRVPAVLVIGAIGTIAGSFVAHAHGYPGRLSIHIVPFACALTMAAASRLLRPVAR